MIIVPRLTINCVVCRNEIVTTQARINSGKKYCSRKCLGVDHWRKAKLGQIILGKRKRRSDCPGVKKTCETCGASFVIKPSRELRCYGRFCSWLCFSTKIRKVCEICGREYGVQRWNTKSKQCSKQCHSLSMKGRIGFWRGKKRPDLKLPHHWKHGAGHPYWKGGVSRLNLESRHCYEYGVWKRAVLKRDKQCVWCGSSERLQADHIKSFSEFPELRFDLNNGRTLCASCHKKTDSYGHFPKKRNLYAVQTS